MRTWPASGHARTSRLHRAADCDSPGGSPPVLIAIGTIIVLLGVLGVLYLVFGSPSESST